MIALTYSDILVQMGIVLSDASCGEPGIVRRSLVARRQRLGKYITPSIPNSWLGGKRSTKRYLLCVRCDELSSFDYTAFDSSVTVALGLTIPLFYHCF
jgi:hypothetical protein